MDVYTPRCVIHGGMKYRPGAPVGGAPDRECGGFVCAGFDGQGCTAGPISCEAVIRVGDSETRWPGIEVTKTTGKAPAP
jgi:hypothetical protein